jgi:hypothetical protein
VRPNKTRVFTSSSLLDVVLSSRNRLLLLFDAAAADVDVFDCVSVCCRDEDEAVVVMPPFVPNSFTPFKHIGYFFDQ